MRELIDLAAVERLFIVLAVALPVLAIAGGALLRARGHRPGRVLLLGLLGPANWLLWRIYNGIEDHYGLDSVKAMLLNLALFVALGVVTGMVVRYWVSGARDRH